MENKLVNWDGVVGGDLMRPDGTKIEVKAFSSNAPTSFGPTENWDLIYFVDCTQYMSKKFRVYKCNLSSSS